MDKLKIQTTPSIGDLSGKIDNLTTTVGDLSGKIDNLTTTVDDLAIIVHKGFVEVKKDMNTRFERVDERFDQIDRRFERIETKFDSLHKVVYHNHGTRLARIEKKLAVIA